MKKIIFIILLFLCSFTLTCCNNNEESTPPTLVSISVVDSSVPNKILVSEFDEKIKLIEIELLYSNEEKKIINLTQDMLFPNDITKLKNGGTYKITVTYEYKETTFNLTTSLVETVLYSVTILYPDGTPVENITLNWMKNNKRVTTTNSDENGKSTVDIAKDEYYISLNDIPSGYIYLQENAVLNEVNNQLTITLIQYSRLLSGEGKQSNPYIVNEGYYLLLFEGAGIQKTQYFKFVANETATFTIKSIGKTNITYKTVDPYLIFVDNDGNHDKSGNLDSTVNTDFEYSFNAEAGKEYTFMVFVSIASDFPVSFILNIEKK